MSAISIKSFLKIFTNNWKSHKKKSWKLNPKQSSWFVKKTFTYLKAWKKGSILFLAFDNSSLQHLWTIKHVGLTLLPQTHLRESLWPRFGPQIGLLLLQDFALVNAASAACVIRRAASVRTSVITRQISRHLPGFLDTTAKCCFVVTCVFNPIYYVKQSCKPWTVRGETN